MDDIAPYRGPAAPAPAARRAAPPAARRPTAHAVPAPPSHAATPYGPDLAAVKTPAHYLGALKRRFWLALLITVPMGTLTSIWALRQPKIYQAMAQIRIQEPQNDEALSALVSRDMVRVGRGGQSSYAADMVTDLQNRGIADRVIAKRPPGPEIAAMDDPAMELIVKNITVRPVGKSNTYTVLLNGRDPLLTKTLLESLLRELSDYAESKRRKQVDQTVEHTQTALNELKTESRALESEMLNQISTLGTIGPGGRNILEEQYVNLGQSIAQQQARAAELQQRMLITPFLGRETQHDPLEARKQQQLERLRDAKEMLTDRLYDIKRKMRDGQFNRDPAAQNIASQLDVVLKQIETVEGSYIKPRMAGDPTELLAETYQREIETAEGRREELLTQMRQAMPDHQKFMTLMDQRESVRKRADEMDHQLGSFQILAKSQTPPIEVTTRIEEPTNPIKPNRMVLIGMGLIVSIGAGLGLVFLLEYVDRSVRQPEHVSHGLGLPLLGVVPRLPRTSATHRGGHLWTSAEPDSAGADAFRNIRASLLGAADRHGPIASLLVTSAKAGDGKSTSALNIAAACARAGERTVLLDVDLRRPTLAPVFPAETDDDEDGSLGLVDVLKGGLPWQATLRHSDLHNLDFIATGDTRGVPVEILGTLEMRQLLAALTHHYDRVILDGPAILGMADCRVLGRMVDAAVMVVRCGAHQTMTLQRAKAVLEQSQVDLVGVVVNNLSEGVQNWSSYGYGPAPLPSQPRRDRKRSLPPSSPAPAPSHEGAFAGAAADV